MKFYEVTILSDVEKLKDYAPKFYRSNKSIIINDSNCQNPLRWCGIDCLYPKNKWCYRSFSIKISEGKLYVIGKSNVLELDINEKDFAVLIMLPIESQMSHIELVSFKYLKEDVVEEPNLPLKPSLEDEECYDELDGLEPIYKPILSEEETIAEDDTRAEPKLLERIIENKVKVLAEDYTLEPFVPTPFDEEK